MLERRRLAATISTLKAGSNFERAYASAERSGAVTMVGESLAADVERRSFEDARLNGTAAE